MSDLIEKQKAVDAIQHRADIVDSVYSAFWEGLIIAQDIVKNIPSAEPERKTGKWIDGILYQDFDESEWEKVKCSVCKNFVVKQIFYHDNKYHYCPYCGADMRGEHELRKSN